MEKEPKHETACFHSLSLRPSPSSNAVSFALTLKASRWRAPSALNLSEPHLPRPLVQRFPFGVDFSRVCCARAPALCSPSIPVTTPSPIALSRLAAAQLPAIAHASSPLSTHPPDPTLSLSPLAPEEASCNDGRTAATPSHGTAHSLNIFFSRAHPAGRPRPPPAPGF